MSLPATPFVSSSSRPEIAHPTRFRLFLLPVLVLLLATSACASSAKNSARGPQGKKLQLTPSQLQVKVRALADPFSGIIEEAVWELYNTSEDSESRQGLLIWQINIINAVQRATFQPEPLAALFDTWALVEQLRDYAEHGIGDRHTEAEARIVLDAANRMEASIVKIATEAGGEDGAETARKMVRDWVDENPIGQFVTRTSTESELARWTARGNMGALATVKSLGASLDDVMARLDLYSEYVPKQASWHAQAIALEWIAPEHPKQILADLSKTASAFDRIAYSLEGYPDVVADERRIVLEMVQDERAIVLEQLLNKFTEIQLFINAERIDLVENQLRIEREAIFEAIARERMIIIAEAKQERADTVDELEEIAGELIERSAVKIVDHFFIRAVQLLAIGLGGLALIAGIVVVLWRRK